ncbi:hypothetical protein [Streptomyces thermodiastaticus]|uniref:hypothetical protein n=1 Tax=Streptomyces thermodiastaticus TaxID=44061 RepID=UPI001675A0B9|nr:hypothetical protein [Streptomyces thermodiastaticus]MCE7548845.1 hypothetical protein [Streptomyces thermodiastaticus]GHF73231.1 hypothetical protein GCM10018787_22350 [Streptomyces thermodiastaticus]
MEAVVTVFAVLFLLCLLLGAYATVKAVTAAKRGVDRTIGQARRAVEDHTLRARTLLQPGVAGELAELRLTLRTSLRATEDALRTGVTEDASLRESVALFQRLKAHGQELDAELKSLENEPDQATLAQRLPALRERTRRITHSADALRWAARDRARHFAEDDLDALSTQIDVESEALRHWTGTGPQRPTAPPAADPAPSAAAQPSAPSGPASAPTGPAPAPATGPDPSRPSLTAPRRRLIPSWMKNARPESTT